MCGFKTIKVLSIAMVSLLSANQAFAWAAGVGAIYSNPVVKDYDDLDFDLAGVSGTFQLGEFDSLLTPAGHLQYATGSGTTPNGKIDANYFEASGTVGALVYSKSNFTLRGTAGIGLGIADLKIKTNTGTNSTDATFVAFPLGLEASYLVPNTNLSFFGSANYKLYIDVGDERIRCADKTISTESGYRVCDNNGGLAPDSSFPIGSMKGVQFGIGAKLFY